MTGDGATYAAGEGRVKVLLQQHGMQDRYQGLHMVRSEGKRTPT